MEAPKSLKHKNSALVLAALAAIFTFLVYLPSLRNGFVNWDDHLYIYENAFIRSLDLKFLKRVFVSVSVSNWHPLTIISYALDYRLWGLNPLGYHLVNVIFHSFNTFLIAALAARLYSLADSDGAGDYGAAFAGIVAALLFGLHPIHVESVTWVSERKDVLSGFFYILSVIAYLKYALKDGTASPLARDYRDNGGGGETESHAFYYFLTIALFILALMSKPMAVTLPAVLLILDFYPLGRLKRFKLVIIEKVPFFILTAISAYLTILAQGKVIIPFERYPFVWRVGNAARAYVFYLYKTILPLPLAPYYPIPANLFGIAFFVSLAFFLIISAFCVLTMRKKKIFTAVWLYYIITLSPVIGIIQVGGQVAADRYTYLPLAGVFIMAGGAAGYFIEHVKKKAFTAAAVAAMLAILSALSILTIRQEEIWRNSITLWSRQLREFNDSTLGYNNRGNAYMDAGDDARAVDDFTSSIRVDSANAGPRNNRDLALAHNNRGLIYLKLRQYGLALEDFNTAVALIPDSPIARSNRGISYLRLGRLEEAIEDLNTSVILDPQNGANYYYLGLAYSQMGDANNASVYFEEAKKRGVKGVVK